MNQATFSPADIAARYGCKPEKILAWIASGELRALNTGTSLNGKKPRWRITAQALEDFERARTTQPAKEPQRRRKSPPSTMKFF